LKRAFVVELGKAQELVGRHVQRGAHLVNQRETGLDLRPLVARVAVFLDAERFGEVARAIEPALRANDLQALGELATYVGSEHFGHDARGFADCAQNVIAKNIGLVNLQVTNTRYWHIKCSYK